MGQEPFLPGPRPFFLLRFELPKPFRLIRGLEENMEVIIHHDVGENFHSGELRHAPLHPAEGLLFVRSKKEIAVHRPGHHVVTSRALFGLDPTTTREALWPMNLPQVFPGFHLRQLQRTPLLLRTRRPILFFCMPDIFLFGVFLANGARSTFRRLAGLSTPKVKNPS